MKLVIQSVFVAVFIVSAVIAVKYFLVSEKEHRLSIKPVVRLIRSDDCNVLQSECVFNLDNKKLKLKLTGTVHTMQPFTFEVGVQNFELDIKDISVSFVMKSMAMGLNQFKLTKQVIAASNSEADIWRASIILPVCISKRSDWEMQVRVETPATTFEADIPVQIN